MDGREEAVAGGIGAVGVQAVDIDAEVEKAMSGLGLLAAGANVIMQLARRRWGTACTRARSRRVGWIGIR